jgi:hypothetical protein
MKLEITEEDHWRIEAALAAHDPTSWLMSNRIRLFSQKDAEFYADFTRAELRASLVAALMVEALERAIVELGGTVDPMHDIEADVRDMMFESGEHDRELWGRLLRGQPTRPQTRTGRGTSTKHALPS